jgi:hypothetical protein
MNLANSFEDKKGNPLFLLVDTFSGFTERQAVTCHFSKDFRECGNPMGRKRSKSSKAFGIEQLRTEAYPTVQFVTYSNVKSLSLQGSLSTKLARTGGHPHRFCRKMYCAIL